MRKSGNFVGGLGGQMTLTLEDKCEVILPTHDKGTLGSVYTLLY